MRKDLLHIIALTKVKNVGPVTFRSLIRHCGGVVEVFESSEKDILSIPNIGKTIFREIQSSTIWKKAEKELAFVEKHGITPLFYMDALYPGRLKQFDDCPVLLYFKGNCSLNHFRTVGIVGTRSPTDYGKSITEKLVEGLHAYQPFIISGMAYGIDAHAHRKSLEFGLSTVGVLGHGLHTLYPQTNRSLAEKILNQGGLLTEFSSEDGPDKEHFPMRNRIIAALSDALIVIESGEKGGSMITADLANQYHKDVFAFPGKTDDIKSAGCNKLIKTHKAALIESVEDIAYVMRWDQMDSLRSSQSTLFVELDETEQKIIQILRENREMTIDTLHYTLKLSISQMANILLNMEFKGVVTSLPGNRYIAT
ncbi:MAG TPA: DNA-processing protein DprA [Saprospiraceae bacterium]|nr:DNA-processing protein DprA [Saprospiraceae bacterium]